MVSLRRYKSDDVYEMAELFYNTVHTINSVDYSEAEINVWADGKVDYKSWDRRYTESFTVIAECDEKIVGFGNIYKGGYLDMLYVHKDYQKMGIATIICNRLEESVEGNITVHASITAKPFFEKRGYSIVKKQKVNRGDISLTNYIMEKVRV